MALIQGKNVVVYIYTNGAWRLYSCARTATLNRSTSIIETSVTGSGNWASFKAQKHSFTGTIDGLINLDDPGILTLPDLVQMQIAMVPLLMRYQRTDEAGNVYTDQATFIITGSTDTGAFDGIATFSIELQGTGSITQIFTPTTQPIPIVKIYPVVGDTLAAAGGETSFTIPLLIGKDIIGVWKDGVKNNAIITSGSPASKEVKYETSIGKFTWAIPFEPGETFSIEYQDA